MLKMDKEQIAVLRKIQIANCCYDGIVNENPSSICDCKYSGEDMVLMDQI